MDRVFPALERRFKANRQLVRWARRLYHGHQGELVKTVRAHVEVTCTDIDHDFDTFDSSQPVYTLVFTVHTRDREATRAGEIMGAVRETFKDADLKASDFDTVRMLLTGGSGPVLDVDTGTYHASLTFALHVSLKVESPVEPVV